MPQKKSCGDPAVFLEAWFRAWTNLIPGFEYDVIGSRSLVGASAFKAQGKEAWSRKLGLDPESLAGAREGIQSKASAEWHADVGL